MLFFFSVYLDVDLYFLGGFVATTAGDLFVVPYVDDFAFCIWQPSSESLPSDAVANDSSFASVACATEDDNLFSVCWDSTFFFQLRSTVFIILPMKNELVHNN